MAGVAHRNAFFGNIQCFHRLKPTGKHEKFSLKILDFQFFFETFEVLQPVVVEAYHLSAVSHYFNYYILGILKWKCSSNLPLFFKKVLAIIATLFFHMIFIIILFPQEYVFIVNLNLILGCFSVKFSNFYDLSSSDILYLYLLL